MLKDKLMLFDYAEFDRKLKAVAVLLTWLITDGAFKLLIELVFNCDLDGGLLKSGRFEVVVVKDLISFRG